MIALAAAAPGALVAATLPVGAVAWPAHREDKAATPAARPTLQSGRPGQRRRYRYPGFAQASRASA